MKNIAKKLFATVLSVALLAGCAPTTKKESSAPAETPKAVEPVDVNVAALKGPTSMGMVQMMKENDEGKITSNNYKFQILSAVDEVTPKIVKGEVDIAAVPANLSSVLYNKMEKNLQVLAINTLGVLYICETGDSIHSVADLKGKTIYASGKGATPEYVLNYILEKNGLQVGTDVTIEWKSEHAECVQALAQDPNAIAMLPQPFVTAASAKNDKIHSALDLTKEWDAIQANEKNKSSLITGVVVARKDFVEAHPEAVMDFLEKYKASIKYVNENNDEAATMIESYDIIAAAVAKKALPFCNITYIDGKDMKEKLSGYLNVLNEQNPKSVGGSLPEDDFYYGAN